MRKGAFTLAEVLITLGIIGIVAAMTLPTVITKTNNTKFQTAFKKTLSAMNQAVNMNKAKNGYDFSSVAGNCIDAKTDTPKEVQSMCSIFNSSLTKAEVLSHTRLYVDGSLYYEQLYGKGATPDSLLKNHSIQLYYYKLNDGTMFAFRSPWGGVSDNTTCSLQNKNIEEALLDTRFQKYCVGFVDVNGINRPNQEVRCNDGKSHSVDINADCTVDDITDVFPIIYYDSVVAPGSAAAKTVLYN